MHAHSSKNKYSKDIKGFFFIFINVKPELKIHLYNIFNMPTKNLYYEW